MIRRMTTEEVESVLDGVSEITLRKEIVDGLRGYCDAVHNLADAQRKLQAMYGKQRTSGLIEAGREKDVLLGLTRAVNHLDMGFSDIPVELWALLLADAQVTQREIATAFLRRDC